jgi:polyhydroxyalkanoate synthase
MSSQPGLDLTSIPERIQLEVQRSIKGAEYFSTSGPTVGATPRDLVRNRGTMSLYHYRPLADEVYRAPVLIVMATSAADAMHRAGD